MKMLRNIAVALALLSPAALLSQTGDERDGHTATAAELAAHTFKWSHNEAVGKISATHTFEVAFGTPPSAATISISPCMAGGTCGAPVTSTVPASAILSVQGIYDYYSVSVTWTGTEANVSVNVTGTHSVLAMQSAVGSTTQKTGSGAYSVSSTGPQGDGCAQFAGGDLSSTGAACGAGNGSGTSNVAAATTAGQIPLSQANGMYLPHTLTADDINAMPKTGGTFTGGIAGPGFTDTSTTNRLWDFHCTGIADASALSANTVRMQADCPADGSSFTSYVLALPANIMGGNTFDLQATGSADPVTGKYTLHLLPVVQQQEYTVELLDATDAQRTWFPPAGSTSLEIEAVAPGGGAAQSGNGQNGSSSDDTCFNNVCAHHGGAADSYHGTPGPGGSDSAPPAGVRSIPGQTGYSPKANWPAGYGGVSGCDVYWGRGGDAAPSGATGGDGNWNGSGGGGGECKKWKMAVTPALIASGIPYQQGSDAQGGGGTASNAGGPGRRGHILVKVKYHD